MNQNGHGYQVVSSDIALGTSGSPVVVYGVNMISDTTAGVVVLRNGTTTGGTLIVSVTGTISTGTYHDFGGGIVFPAGCFVDITANVTPSCTVVYEKI